MPSNDLVSDRSRSPHLWAAFFLVSVACEAWQYRFSPVPARFAAGIAALVAGVALFLCRHRFPHGRSLLPWAGAFVASVLLAALRALAGVDAATPAYALARELTPLLLGWSLAVLWLAASTPVTHDSDVPAAKHFDRAPFWAVGLVIVAALAGAAAFQGAVNGRAALSLDETMYLMQSRLWGAPHFALHIEPALHSFFRVPLAHFAGASVQSHYPPGWPAVLGVFQLLGAAWWAAPVLGAVSVLGIYFIGRQVESEIAGVLAAALLATHPWFLSMSGSYFAHTAAMACGVTAAWILLRAERALEPDAARRWGAWLAAGFILGLAVTIRPLTGIALGSSVVLWLFIRRQPRPHRAALMVAWLALGALPPAVGLLAYNRATTGSPWVLGYTAANGNRHDMGFGTRRHVGADDRGAPLAIEIEFTPRFAIRQLALRASDVAWELLPGFTIVPLLLLAVRSRFRYRRRTMAAFCLLPLFYFFYWSTDYWRYYSELLPFALLGSALLITHTAARSRAALTALAVAFVGGSALTAITELRDLHIVTRHRRVDLAQVRSAGRRYGKILVFVPTPRGEQQLFEQLWYFNAERFPGRRDRGAGPG